jgi:DNA end-binding protein Ku
VAPRPYWKGYLKLSLVTCAVSLTSATSERDKVRFHTLNRETGNRIKSRYTDAESGKPVKDEDQVRGFELSDGRQLVIEDEEIEAVGLESTRTIDIVEFVPARTIDWIWYDTPYYLTPDDEIAHEAFSVIREAMKVTKMVGISRLVLSRRERAVMLEPRGKGIVLWTLRYGDEVRDPDLVFGNVADGERAVARIVSRLQVVRPVEKDGINGRAVDECLDTDGLVIVRRGPGKFFRLHDDVAVIIRRVSLDLLLGRYRLFGALVNVLAMHPMPRLPVQHVKGNPLGCDCGGIKRNGKG